MDKVCLPKPIREHLLMFLKANGGTYGNKIKRE